MTGLSIRSGHKKVVVSILFRYAQPNRKHFYYKFYANNTTVCGGSRQRSSLLQQLQYSDICVKLQRNMRMVTMIYAFSSLQQLKYRDMCEAKYK